MLANYNSFVLRFYNLQNVTLPRPLFAHMQKKFSKNGTKFLFFLFDNDVISRNLGTCYRNCTRGFGSTISDSLFVVKKQKTHKMFRLGDYDCVGFDLDNTLLRYQVRNLVSLEYEALSKFLVDEKGYNPKHLLKPLEEKMDFLQKGLFLDFSNGNLLKIGVDGFVLKASHGTKFMSVSEIKGYYGLDRKWDVTKEFSRNMIDAWNGPLSEKVRTCLDYFDMPSALAFARIVDSLDEKFGKKQDVYNIWPDVLAGLMHLFNRDHFSLLKEGYFPTLKSNPDHYLKKCSPSVIEWLHKIKKTKPLFLVTGSNVDFASFTSKYTFGDDWRSLFDVVVCYARKPGFFFGDRPFLKLEGYKETDIVKGVDLEFGNIYSQGNWKELYQLLARKTQQEHPKCVYIGDNLIQDIYTPAAYANCDTVSVVEELCAEGMLNPRDDHSDADNVLVSNSWGSYFYSKDEENIGNSIWDEVIRKYSKICIPHVDALANHPLDFEIASFNSKDADSGLQHKQSGYFPNQPISKM